MKKVCVLVPCFNGEVFLDRLFSCFLSQTYPSIRIVLVNDGSTDNSAAKCEAYRAAFQQRGIEFVYVEQVNRGPGGAIDTGLKHVTGEFVSWIDVDDWLEPTAIEERVAFLEEHADCVGMRSNGFWVEEDFPDGPYQLYYREPQYDAVLFDQIIDDSCFLPAQYMFRVNVLRRAIPDMSICQSRQGQNVQLLLPLSYQARVGYLDRPLFYGLVRAESVSRRRRSYSEAVDTLIDRRETYRNTLRKMSVPESAVLIDRVDRYCTAGLLWLTLWRGPWADKVRSSGYLRRCGILAAGRYFCRSVWRRALHFLHRMPSWRWARYRGGQTE